MITIRCFSRLYSGRKVGLAIISFLARWGEIVFRVITSLVCLVNYFSLQLQLCPVGQFRTSEENLCRGVLKTFWIFWHLFYVEKRGWRHHRTRNFRIYPTGVDLGFAWVRKNISCNYSGTRAPVSRAICVLGLITGTSIKSRSDFQVSLPSKATNHWQPNVRSVSVPWRWNLPTIQRNIKTVCIYPW